ncbi:MAG: aspartate carbamoyltransferase catalytic subunit [Coprobacillus cateniformis]
MKNIVNLSDLSLEQIHHLIDEAIAFKNGKTVDYHQKKVVANLFFEPSTRTHYSFDMAAGNLGCRTQNFEASNSSLKKGETLYDTCKLFESIGCDALVIRHTDDDYYKQLEGIHIPILNAGDGKGNHPSQSLLDLMTIKEEFGHFEGLKVVIVGDILHSRVAHSNYDVMQRLGMQVYTSGPLEYKQDGCNYVDFDDVIEDMDVVMLLRVQHERHAGDEDFSKENYHRIYGLSLERYKRLKETAIIMHPAPINRDVEIKDELVESGKSRIFRQMHNGVFIRMAMIHEVLENE